MLVERLVPREQVVRPDDRRVAPRVARADVALLEDRHVADAVVFREVVRGGQPVPAAADDDHVIRGLRRRVAPRGGPASMAVQRLADQAGEGVAHGPHLRSIPPGHLPNCGIECTIYDMASVEHPIRSVGFLLIPGYALLSYAASVEPLRAANMLSGRTLYRWWNAAPGDKPAIASNGAAVLPDMKIGAESEPPDLLLVCAGGNPSVFKDRRAFAWLRRLAAGPSIIGGVSGGPFILARAGLLEKRRFTVHWEHLPALREEFPHLHVTQSLFELDRELIAVPLQLRRRRNRSIQRGRARPPARQCVRRKR